MAVQTKPRQLAKAPFVQRLRELLDGGASHDQIIERMNPVRGMSVTAAFTDAERKPWQPKPDK